MSAFRNQGDQFRDNSGNILSAGSVSYYQAGTGILQASYSDSGLTTPNSNPILLDADGRLDDRDDRGKHELGDVRESHDRATPTRSSRCRP